MSEQIEHVKRLLDESPTFKHVLDFAFRMESKLAKNRHKGDRDAWLKDDVWSLFRRIQEELNELETAMNLQSSFSYANDVTNEAADVANFCMMVADSISAMNVSATTPTPVARLDGEG